MNSRKKNTDNVSGKLAGKKPITGARADINNANRPVLVYDLCNRGLQLPKYSILLAEDDQSSREAIHDLLDKLGFKVDTASNGKEAVDLALANNYSLILMDCQMPVMDGYEAARTIRRGEMRLPGHVPIVAITADATRQERIQFVEAGMDDFVIKPVDLKMFIETIYYWTMLFQFKADSITYELP